jgi:hypothetical protein
MFIDVSTNDPIMNTPLRLPHWVEPRPQAIQSSLVESLGLLSEQQFVQTPPTEVTTANLLPAVASKLQLTAVARKKRAQRGKLQSENLCFPFAMIQGKKRMQI